MSNNKFGILFCGYNSEEYVEQSLSPFINRENFVISAVSVPFLEYRAQNQFEDSTVQTLREYRDSGKIHNLVDFPKYIKEHDARNLALDYLKKEKVDFFFLVDSDELYSEDEINQIIKFVESDTENVWWRICLKNFVFDKKTYLAEPFTPPRIFKTQSDDYILDRMYWDNDFRYRNIRSNDFVSQEQLNNSTIPKEIAWVDHFTWMNDETSKRKVEYQNSRGWVCSYSWDEGNNCLTFNEEYYKLRGEEKPELVRS